MIRLKLLLSLSPVSMSVQQPNEQADQAKARREGHEPRVGSFLASSSSVTVTCTSMPHTVTVVNIMSLVSITLKRINGHGSRHGVERRVLPC